MTTTKSWNKLSTVFSEVLSETLDKAAVETIMTKLNNKRSQLSKFMNNSTTKTKQKDPNAPKKFNTSYILFCGEYRDKIKKANPDMTTTQITSKLGEMWKGLSDKEKKRFEELSKKDKARYEKEMETYTPPVTNETETKERTGPKRPLTAYMYFCQEKRPEIKKQHPDMNGSAITSELASQWKKLTPEQKAPFDAKQAADKTRYEGEKSSGVVTEKKTEKKTTKSEAVVEQKKESKKKEVKKTEQPQTPGYKYFVNDQSEEVLSENPDWNSKKVLAEVNKRWAELSSKDKKEYEDEALAEREEEELELEDE